MIQIYIIEFPSGHAYVGASICATRRLRVHLNSIRRGIHENPTIGNILADNSGRYTFRILEECPKEIAVTREQYWIDESSKTMIMLNMELKVHPSHAGRHHTEDAKRRISEGCTGHRGRILTTEESKRLHTFRKPMSGENRDLTRQLALSRRRPVINIDTGEVFPCVADAAQALGCHPGSVRDAATGKLKTIKGFHFRFQSH